MDIEVAQTDIKVDDASLVSVLCKSHSNARSRGGLSNPTFFFFFFFHHKREAHKSQNMSVSLQSRKWMDMGRLIKWKKRMEGSKPLPEVTTRTLQSFLFLV